MSNRRRVVVTGMGLVSCFGNEVDAFYDALLEGKSGVRPIEHFPCDEYPTRFAAWVGEYDSSEYLDKKQARRVDPFIRNTTVAGKKALKMALLTGESLDKINKEKAGVIIGSGMGGLCTFYEGTETLLNRGVRKLSPFFVPFIITNMGGAFLGIELGFMGPNYSISTACATGNYSIVAAANHIRRGDADIMLCGGSEAAISPIGLAGFVATRTLSERNDAPEKASRPWDKGRDGFVMGEGAGVLVLESLEHALERGAPILAEYLGGSINCDAYHITAPREDGKGVAQCIEMALRDGNVAKDEVNYINAHATSTQVGDMMEVAAIHQVFASHAKKLYMNATKSLIGHCLGAAGGVEAIVAIKAIQKGRLHPTINLENPEEGLGVINPVKDKALDVKVGVALSNSFGFGGHNSIVMFSEYRGA